MEGQLDGWHEIFLLLVQQQLRLCREIVAAEYYHVVRIRYTRERVESEKNSR
jgi:hypothetical protein